MEHGGVRVSDSDNTPMPQGVFVVLTSGDRVPCSVTEIPEPTAEGLRHFRAMPSRSLAVGEHVASMELAMLPAHSTISLEWWTAVEPPPGCEDAPGRYAYEWTEPIGPEGLPDAPA